MNPGEIKWTHAVVDDIRSRGGLVFAVVASMMQEPGWPDRHITHRRWQGFVEFKGLNTIVKKKQRAIIREINRRRPGTAFIARWPGVVEDWDGTVLGEFDGTGLDLLILLEMLYDSRNKPNPTAS